MFGFAAGLRRPPESPHARQLSLAPSRSGAASVRPTFNLTSQMIGANTMASFRYKTFGYAARSADTPLRPFSFERRALRPNDVAMEILYCGICHSDLHMSRNDWNWSFFPLVPGHEIIGRVVEVGPE